ncbi:origin recognition complex subunit 5 C-terminus-domain-containing protein [Durotheca rogersii]|uniref:origin recognition complex subunit 5 C-terminus-domain-containing protein n=1 Tax=Durotheca rogersii TaxID=419775 RepID=UPI002220D1CB|nr:origin recognition complex subunit 5 C-terminus-domain-containing protein [Durotheca rogersii]KAI5854535.1 origin recognition complex subunit 5 C-terminus-domain-containing protein [Durotheca rogersii]
MASLFKLPDELLATLVETFPCRDAQIRAFATLLYPCAAPCRNLIVYGPEATGKSAITARLLGLLRDRHSRRTDSDDDRNGGLVNHAIIKSAECVTARHLFERIVGSVGDALQWRGGAVGRCETLAALTVELAKMLKYVKREEGWRFVLVFDGIDRQREAPPTLLAALARLPEIMPNLTTVFILTTPSPSLLRVSSAPQLYFPPYTKSEYVTILSHSSRCRPPTALPNTTPQETADLWARFAAAVHDALAKPASSTLPGLERACAALWPRFTAPVAAGTHRAREFTKLLVAARAYFQDESMLEPGIALAPPNTKSSTSGAAGTAMATDIAKKRGVMASNSTTDLAALLPRTARLLLIAAYLASHNAPRHDQTLFSTWHHQGRRGRRGGAHHHASKKSRHRKIARKLLGPSAFVLERMVAIYAATRREWIPGPGADVDMTDESQAGRGSGSSAGSVDGDVGMAIATLTSLRLLVRVGAGSVGAVGIGGGDTMDRGGKWRVGVGWEVVRSVGRSIGVEVEEWLVE